MRGTMEIKEYIESKIVEGKFVNDFIWIREQLPAENIYEWLCESRTKHIYESYRYQALTILKEAYKNGEIQR